MKNRCLLCKSLSFEKCYSNTRENDNHCINKCLYCGHIQLYPIDYEPQEYYDKDTQDKMGFGIANREKSDFYEMLLSQSKRRILYLEKYIDQLLKTHDYINVCDVGGGTGFFVQEMVQKYKNKINIFLLEPSKTRIIIDNVVVINELLDENVAKLYQNKFHIVTCFHVLEHVFEPMTFIDCLKNITTDDGILCIEVPNQNNEIIKLSSNYEKNVWYCNAHVSYFTPNILKKIILESNMNIIYMNGFQRYGLLNFLHWIQYNEPLKKQKNYYTGHPVNSIEEQWINEISENMTSDSMYIICKK